jgi:hypothetical protein
MGNSENYKPQQIGKTEILRSQNSVLNMESGDYWVELVQPHPKSNPERFLIKIGRITQTVGHWEPASSFINGLERAFRFYKIACNALTNGKSPEEAVEIANINAMFDSVPIRK